MKDMVNSASRMDHSSQDFTLESLSRYVSLAMQNYTPVSYSTFSFSQNFVLWRHDIDYSINRALKVAEMESSLGMHSTFFVNPHSEFYNMQEKSQCALLEHIVKLGHEVGLHFEATFYDSLEESQLDEVVWREAQFIEQLVGVQPVAMSFHNPTESHLEWQAPSYGGLINAYGNSLMKRVSYVSDSNGYWRFRRLEDVLTGAQDRFLQVLTHPGWWQDKPMPARSRIYRSVFGRAASTMRQYDSTLESFGRENISGIPTPLNQVKRLSETKSDLIDYLWNQEAFEALFVELWRLHEVQLNKLCRAKFRKQWRIPAHEVNALFASDGVSLDGWRLFEVAFGQPWAAAIGIKSIEHRQWVGVRNQLIHGREAFPPMELQRGCSYLATIVTALATWGLQQPFQYDGLAPLGSIGLPTVATAEGSLVEELDEGVASNGRGMSRRRLIEWEQLKARLLDGQTAPIQPQT